MRGLAFFFGSVRHRGVADLVSASITVRKAPYIGPSCIGIMDFPLRMLVPFALSVVMFVALQIFCPQVIGRAIWPSGPAGARMMAIDPVRVKRSPRISIATHDRRRASDR